jgi:hypothetical protein
MTKDVCVCVLFEDLFVFSKLKEKSIMAMCKSTIVVLQLHSKWCWWWDDGVFLWFAKMQIFYRVLKKFWQLWIVYILAPEESATHAQEFVKVYIPVQCRMYAKKYKTTGRVGDSIHHSLFFCFSTQCRSGDIPCANTQTTKSCQNFLITLYKKLINP